MDTGSDFRLSVHRSSLILCGVAGMLMTGSMFFRYVYGPMGGVVSYFGILRSNLSWGGAPMLLPLWPVAFGFVETICTAVTLLAPGWRGGRIHSIALAALLFAVAATQVGFLLCNVGLGKVAWGQALKTCLPAVCAGAGMSVTIIGIRSAWRRAAVSRLVGAIWVAWGVHPISDWTPAETVLWAYGPGYWMLLVGTVILIEESVRQLVTFGLTARRPTAE